MVSKLKTLSPVWALYLFNPLLASAAVLTRSTVPHAPMTLPNPANITTIANSSIPTPHPNCIIPPSSPSLVIDLHTCQPTFDQLLSTPHPDHRRTYYRSTRPIHLAYAPCAITLGRQLTGDNGIAISMREIVGLAYRIVMFCEPAAIGGWTDVDGLGDWILSVTARMPDMSSEKGVSPRLLIDETTW